MFSITIEQKERQSSKVGVRSVLTLAEIAGIQYLQSVIILLMRRG